MNKIIYSLMMQYSLLRKIIFFVVRGPMFNFLNRNFWYVIFESFGRKNINELDIDFSLQYTKECIDKGIEWLLINQSLQGDNGISNYVTFNMSRTVLGGSFPEVTGYIIPTLFDYSSTFSKPHVYEAAVKAAEFELTYQHEDGSFPEGNVGKLGDPSVFNTAQIVHGLVRSYKETKDKKYRDAFIKACDWIVGVQEKDGSWKRFNYKGMKRTYDTKVSQALLEADNVVNSNKYVESAKDNLEFVLLNQKENGWFYNCDNSYERNDTPLLHLIGYTVQGLLVAYSFLKNEELLETSVKTLKRLLHKFEVNKQPLPGRFDSNWQPVVRSSCVTGLAQISLCWMDVYEITKDNRYLNASLKMNDFLKSIQFNSNDKKIRGALPGSYPLWGDYNPYAVNSWGVKYYLDALMQEYRIKRDIMRDYQ